MTATAPPLLALERVTAGQDGLNETIREVSLDLRKGEIMAVTTLDPSGGKTTLLLAAAGLLEPISGAVRFEGQDVASMSYAQEQRFRARLGVVLEQGGLLENRTILENVALPLRYHTKLRGRELDLHVERLIRRAGFTEDPRAYPWQVSGRGRRLAALARALSRDPSLVIVDRFFEGLDMPDWTRLFEVVLELNRHEGTTWLIAAELDPVLFQLAERVAVLEKGRLLACGTRRELFVDERIRRAFEASDAAALRRKSERWTSMRRPLLGEIEGKARETLRLDGLLPAPIVDPDQDTISPEAWREEQDGFDADATFMERAKDEPALDPYATFLQARAAAPKQSSPPSVAPVVRDASSAPPNAAGAGDREPTPATGRLRPPRDTRLVEPFEPPGEVEPPAEAPAPPDAPAPEEPAAEPPANDTRRARRLAPRYVPETEWERDVLMGALRDRLEGKPQVDDVPPPAAEPPPVELPAGARPRDAQEPPPSLTPTPVAVSDGAQPDVLTTIDAVVDAAPREPLSAPRAWSDPAGSPGAPPPTDPAASDDEERASTEEAGS